MFTRGGMIMNTVLSACEGFPDTKFHPGDVLLRAGESTRRLYILVEGEVEVLKGNFPVATLSEPGTMFGEIAILLNIPHTATIKVSILSRVVVLQQGRDFLQSNPSITYELAQTLAKRLHSTSWQGKPETSLTHYKIIIMMSINTQEAKRNRRIDDGLEWLERPQIVSTRGHSGRS